MADTRIERDSLGEVEVPAAAYWGAQTARAIENYPISGLRPHPALVEGTVRVKLAAARANAKVGGLDAEIAKAIEKACEEILGGALHDQFVVDPYQAGAGTSHHMNVNEVIASRASELLGGARSPTQGKVHPNDDVNKAQSTNDVMPTAGRLAALRLAEPLLDALESLCASIEQKASETLDLVKSARTHLQDAPPIRMGREIGAWATNLRHHQRALQHAKEGLFALGIGGTAAGTGLTAAPGYRELVVEDLAKQMELPLTPSDDLYEAMQSLRPLAHFSAALRALSLDLYRITADLRLLSSGPSSGLDELRLPAVQPGSSIMPGKINPSIPEMVSQVCVRVIGNDTTVAWSAASGQLELNVFIPVAVHTLLESETILTNAMKVLDARCVAGMAAKVDRLTYYAERSQQLVLALVPRIGYERAAGIAKRALEEDRSIAEQVIAEGLLSEKEAREILDPARMAGN